MSIIFNTIDQVTPNMVITITDEYPLRYVARSVPQWIHFLSDNHMNRGGLELGYYKYPMTNPYFPGLWAGYSISLTYGEGNGRNPYLLLQKNYTAPTQKRETLNKTWKFPATHENRQIAQDLMVYMCYKINKAQATHRQK